MVQQVLLHHIHKIGRRAAFKTSADNLQRNFFGIARLFGGDGIVFRHGQQGAIPRFHGTLGTSFRRRVTVGRVDDPSQKCRFRQRHIAHVLVEIGQGSFAKSVDREASAISEVNLVGVELKDLLLGKAALEFEGHHGFGNLAPPSAVRTEKEATGHLHGNGAAALHARPMAQVGPGGAEDADRINAGMLEEAPVLDRQHGVSQHFGDVVEIDGAAFLTGVIEQAGEHFRLDFGGIQQRAAIHRMNILNFLAAEGNDNSVLPAKIRFAGRTDFNFIAVENVAPRSAGDIQFAVAGSLQVIRKLFDGEVLAGGDFHRSGVDAGGGLLDMPGKTLVNHPAIGNPVIRRHAGDKEEDKQSCPN